MVSLAEDQVEAYRAEGYLVVPDVLSAQTMTSLRAATEAMVAKAAAGGRSDSVFDFGAGSDGPELRRIKAPERHDPAYAAVLVDDGILEAVASLLGPAIRFWASKLNIKQAHGGQAVEWHQDWAFGPATNDDQLTVGIALDDATIENGCLLVIPGSHRGPLLDHWRDGRFVGAVTDPSFAATGAVPLEVAAGGITLHHTRTIHGSAPNRSAGPRRLLLYSYAAADSWPLSGVRDRGAFDAKLLRGSPCDAPRLEAVPVAPWPRWEEEELGADTSIFDFQDRVGRSSFG
jgi:ectoine hydroxylase-related dioxygenase (phytanoyl-CoA dioxygenase family)